MDTGVETLDNGNNGNILVGNQAVLSESATIQSLKLRARYCVRRNGRNHMKVEQLSELALDCIHSAARALALRDRPAFYGEVAKGLETLWSGRVGAAAGQQINDRVRRPTPSGLVRSSRFPDELNNGKSTFLEILHTILGEYAIAADACGRRVCCWRSQGA
jgi:hypothetical protein